MCARYKSLAGKSLWLFAIVAVNCSAGQPLKFGIHSTMMLSQSAADGNGYAGQPRRADALGSGDQLVLNIPDLDEVKNLTVRISPDGSLDLPLIGVVHVEGLTIPALRELLAARYTRYIANPQISLQVTSSQGRTISILGEVNTPGMQEITGPLTLLGAISRAGGIRPDAGPQVIISRSDDESHFTLPDAMVTNAVGHQRAVLPLDDLLAEHSPEDNILLRSGDVITIPKGSIVYVVGEVHKAGGFPLHSSGHVSLVEALALAEGLGPNAKSSNAKILRLEDSKTEARKEIPVNIGDILAGKKPDPLLIADDILFVPTSAAKSGARRVAEAVLQVTTGILIYR